MDLSIWTASSAILEALCDLRHEVRALTRQALVDAKRQCRVGGYSHDEALAQFYESVALRGDAQHLVVSFASAVELGLAEAMTLEARCLQRGWNSRAVGILFWSASLRLRGQAQAPRSGHGLAQLRHQSGLKSIG